MTVADCVTMNLERVLAVFEIVRDRSFLSRELLRLAHGHKTSPQAIGEGRRENETTRLNANHGIDVCAFKLRSQGVDGFSQTLGMFQQGRDVVKVYAGFWKVGDFANQLFQFVHDVGWYLP